MGGVRAIPSHEIFVGALVLWMHTPRGGYGYASPVDARVVGLNLDGTIARIEVARRDGSTVERRVMTENLRWRDDAPRMF
jgi:hypothetical protein